MFSMFDYWLRFSSFQLRKRTYSPIEQVRFFFYMLTEFDMVFAQHLCYCSSFFVFVVVVLFVVVWVFMVFETVLRLFSVVFTQHEGYCSSIFLLAFMVFEFILVIVWGFRSTCLLQVLLCMSFSMAWVWFDLFQLGICFFFF